MPVWACRGPQIDLQAFEVHPGHKKALITASTPNQLPCCLSIPPEDTSRPNRRVFGIVMDGRGGFCLFWPVRVHLEGPGDRFEPPCRPKHAKRTPTVHRNAKNSAAGSRCAHGGTERQKGSWLGVDVIISAFFVVGVHLEGPEGRFEAPYRPKQAKRTPTVYRNAKNSAVGSGCVLRGYRKAKG